MKEPEKLEYEYEIINKYINDAINFLLKKQEFECMKTLESLKLFSKSVFSAKFLTGDEN